MYALRNDLGQPDRQVRATAGSNWLQRERRAHDAVMTAKIFEVHPRDPQRRSLDQVAALLQDGAVIVYPTDSGYALGARIDNHEGAERIRRIRNLGSDHHFTLVCADFAQLGQLVYLTNSAFRAIKAATPGPYTFVLPATREVPRRLHNAKKKTVGVRIPDNPAAHELVETLGEPLLSSTLLLPGDDGESFAPGEVEDFPGWLLAQVDAVLDAGPVRAEPTTVVDFSGPTPVVLRHGAGDARPFS